MIIRLVSIGTVLLLVTACSSGEVKRNLGLQKQAPDEFMVLSRPPLTVPPDFALRPPADGAELSRERTRERAARTLYQRPSERLKEVDAEMGSGEEALLEKAGAKIADPNVREKISEENRPGEGSVTEQYPLADVLGIEYQEPVVDAQAERERLSKNKREGKDVTEGETPIIDPEDRGFLGNIF